RFAQYTSFEEASAVDDLTLRAAAYGMPGVTLDGADAVAVLDAAESAVSRARAGEGPTFLNVDTYRYHGHYIGDAEEYRTADDVQARRDRDCIVALEARLAEAGVLDGDAARAVWDEVTAEVAAAEAFAEESPYPEPESALDAVYTA